MLPFEPARQDYRRNRDGKAEEATTRFQFEVYRVGRTLRRTHDLPAAMGALIVEVVACNKSSVAQIMSVICCVVMTGM